MTTNNANTHNSPTFYQVYMANYDPNPFADLSPQWHEISDSQPLIPSPDPPRRLPIPESPGHGAEETKTPYPPDSPQAFGDENNDTSSHKSDTSGIRGLRRSVREMKNRMNHYYCEFQLESPVSLTTFAGSPPADPSLSPLPP